jgi:hypothetical protein
MLGKSLSHFSQWKCGLWGEFAMLFTLSQNIIQFLPALATSTLNKRCRDSKKEKQAGNKGRFNSYGKCVVCPEREYGKSEQKERIQGVREWRVI